MKIKLSILFLLCTSIALCQSPCGTTTNFSQKATHCRLSVSDSSFINTMNVSGKTTMKNMRADTILTGTVYMGNVIDVAHGGTGQTTSSAVTQSFLPAQSGNSGRVLGTNGSVPSWVTVTTGTVTSVTSANSDLSVVNTTTTPVLTVISAPKLTNSRTIQGVAFDGTSNINLINGTGFVKASGTTISYDNSTYLTGNQNITISGDVSGSGATAITTTLSNSGVTAGTYDWVTVDAKGRVTAGANTPVQTAIAAGDRNFNQAYQISATRPARISVSVELSCSLSLSGGTSGQVILETSADGSTNWIFSGMVTASNTGSLTIGLNTTQISGSSLVENLPIGYYWRIRTNTITGTPTYTFNGGNQRTY